MASNHVPPPVGIDPHRFPPDPWRLVETHHDPDDLGTTETLFAVGNGYLGLRANPEEGRDAHAHGTYVNGFHETWEIQHAENAYGFAKVGQTIVNAPDAKLIKLYVDDEPLLLGKADLESYERSLDFRNGILTRDLVWLTPSGKRVQVRSTRMVSVEDRHLALLTFDVTMLEGSGPITVSSQLLNRQDGVDEYHVESAALGEGEMIADPRQARGFDHRVLVPHHQRSDDADRFVALGYRAANSGMTIAAAMRHLTNGVEPWSVETTVEADQAKTVFEVELDEGDTFSLTKLASYHTSTGVPSTELADRCARTIGRAVDVGVETLLDRQRACWESFWAASDVRVTTVDATSDPTDERSVALQQAIRWNIFQLGQASLSTHEQGVAAKAVTAGGYDGHYFWDTEIYVIPFLAVTNPSAARKLLRFRWRLLDAARKRAGEMSENGALYPWRTINGEEASAYYAAGTAQYHINAAIVWALARYLDASGDVDFLANEGAEVLVETARLWDSLGFYSSKGNGSAGTFHIHRVTGPDEYTTVVNDNCYTNLMARFNLRYAARTVRFLAQWNPAAFDDLQRRTELDLAELDRWDAAADAMYIPYDDERMVHPQDSSFLDLEPWDWDGTPHEKYPLLLNFHPLVIYRHQVLKQTDVVLAMYLRTQHFSAEQKRRNFDFYDPITTGDSSLSACVQAIVAAEVGHGALADDYFARSLLLDLCDVHGNTADGVHIASCGGVWAGLVHGFTGLVDSGEALSFTPRLPAAWARIEYRLERHGCVVDVVAERDAVTLTMVDGIGVPIDLADGTRVFVAADQPVTISRS